MLKWLVDENLLIIQEGCKECGPSEFRNGKRVL